MESTQHSATTPVMMTRSAFLAASRTSGIASEEYTLLVYSGYCVSALEKTTQYFEAKTMNDNEMCHVNMMIFFITARNVIQDIVVWASDARRCDEKELRIVLLENSYTHSVIGICYAAYF